MLNPDLIQPVAIQSVLLYPPRCGSNGPSSRSCTAPSASTSLTRSSRCFRWRQYDERRWLARAARAGPPCLQERIPENQSTYATLRDFEHIIQDFWTAFTPGIFVTQEVVIESLWPIEGMLSQEFLEERCLRVGRAQAASLGAACAGVGLKFVFPQFAPAKAVELRLEPFFRDPKFLFVAISSQDLQPIQAPNAAAERVRWAEHFLGHEVANFVRSVV